MMSAQKRSQETIDPDYVDAGEQQVKRQRALEQDAKETVGRKIQTIVQNEFQREINLKETELQNIDKRLNDALLQMDRLRACIVASYYGQKHPSSSSQASTRNAPPPSIHPAVKKHLGKAPKGHSLTRQDVDPQAGTHTQSHERLRPKEQVHDKNEVRSEQSTDSQRVPATVPSGSMSALTSYSDRQARYKTKKKVIVGNVSKYIPVDNREANDMSSHKWMVYVRGPKTDPDISSFVRKVWFFLHHSYKPNDLVEVSSPPFHLTRRGWGEFPVRVQLHFVDPRNKKVDIIHHLKLDKTFTGLQTLGAEMVVEVEINREGSSAVHSSAALPASSLHLPGASHGRSSSPVSQRQHLPSSVSTENESSSSHKEISKDKASKLVNSSRPPGQSLHKSLSTNSQNSISGNGDQSEQAESLSDVYTLIKKEILQNDEGGSEAESHETSSKAEEYHMTIAHEQGPSQSKTIKEEPDQDVDVCAHEDKNRKTTHPMAKIRPMNISYVSAINTPDKALVSVVEDEAMETSNSLLPSETNWSDSLSIVTTLAETVTPKLLSMAPATNLPGVSLKSSASLSSSAVIVHANSQVQDFQSSSSSSGKPGLNQSQPMKMTIIKDPSKLRPPLAATSTSIAVTKTCVEVTLPSHASSVSYVTTTCTTTVATAQITAGCIPSSSSSTFPQPKIYAQNSGDVGLKLPSGALQQQPPGAPISKMVVIKPNTNLAKKLVYTVDSPLISNGLIASSAGTTLQLGSHENFSGHISHKSQTAQVYKPGAGGIGVPPVVIARAPAAVARPRGPKPGGSRQVSLLTGLVVGNQAKSSKPVSPAASQSLLGNRPVREGRVVLSSTVSHPSIPTSANSHAPATLQPSATPQVLLWSKPSTDGQTVVLPKQSVQVNTASGRTLIKVLNKAPVPHSIPQTVAPIKILNTIPKKIDSHLSSATLVSNVQSLLTQTNSPMLVSGQTSLDSGAIGVTPSNVELGQHIQQPHLATPSSSSAQVMLSFPGGGVVPMTHEQKPVHFPKMSAVGITKYGKGYRSILTQQGSKKNLTHEDRLKGQYEVLRAFKENPELYRKKSKKVVLATNDTLEGEEDVIPQLQLEDYRTMKTLVKAAVLLHPLIQEDVNKITHPYCAKSIEEWNSWPVGKQRAAEWHRACFTLRYLKLCLAGQAEFKGEKLMSTRQLMDWCRSHAFSPALPVKHRASDRNGDDKSVGAAAIKYESFYQSLCRNQVQSFTPLDGLRPLLSGSQAGGSKDSYLQDDKELLNVVDEDTSPTPMKIERPGEEDNETADPDGWIPPSRGASFVYDQLRKRGVRLEPQRLNVGVMACLPAEMVYRVMVEFCSDVLRETLAVCENTSSEVTARDVHRALTSLPEAAFCCNKFLGKPEEQDLELAASR